MKPPLRTNSLPISTMALLIDDAIRYLKAVNQYSGGMISDIKHMLVFGSDTFMPKRRFTVSR
ncbi:S ribonuclease [Pyrus ussuriensis x Pyrus communis]|uniref:S ribonuclease n=1 Tax=Pyrus ussuriensis x Pyrus communis TaxID=2448454 RepID=A0A5N5FP27_9ROSA|nr:S ribonuclease [Pyrus ussuriensis x Pyrus communis]